MSNRKGKGRQKIAIKKIEDENHLQVTFSKRRSGLFKKASELCTLCEAELAILVFSPGNKVYAFGHPSVFSTINRYLTNIGDDNIFPDNTLGVNCNTNMEELNKELTYLEDNLAKEKVKRKQLVDSQTANEGRYWWDGPGGKDNLTLDQLEILKAMMQELLNDVQIEKQRINCEANNNAGNVQINPFNRTGYAQPQQVAGNPHTNVNHLDGTSYYLQQAQKVAPYDPTTPVYFTSDGTPYQYAMVNLFNYPNNPINIVNPKNNDGAGPSETRP